MGYQFIGFDDENDGTGTGVNRIGFSLVEDGAHTAGEIYSGVVLSGDGDAAVDEEERGPVGGRGRGDAGAFFQMKAANVGVARAVGEGEESGASGAEGAQTVGGVMGEVDDVHVVGTWNKVGGADTFWQQFCPKLGSVTSTGVRARPHRPRRPEYARA